MMDKEKVKNKALMLAELCITDTKRFAREYKEAYESGEFKDNERDVLLPLCNVYVAVKREIASRADGVREQRRILAEAVMREASDK